MFGSKKHTTTTGTTSTSGGFLSRLRSSNPNSTARKPVYTTGTTRTGIGKTNKKHAGTTTGVMGTHKKKATLSQKVHGAATVASGKMHNNHAEVRAGESKFSILVLETYGICANAIKEEMQGKNPNSGLFSHGSGTTKNTRF